MPSPTIGRHPTPGWPGAAIEGVQGAEDEARFTPRYLADLSLADLEHERRSADRHHAARPRTLAIVLALQPEVVRLGVLSAACASVANALSKPCEPGRSPPNPRLLLRYYPSESSRYILAASRYRRMTRDTVVARCLDELNEVIVEAIGATIMLAGAGFDLADGPISAESLAGTWRRVCRSTIDLLSALGAELDGFRLAPAIPLSGELGSTLALAADGEAPLLGATGNIELPVWAELRRSPRLPIDSPAVMHWSGGEAPVRLSDISTGGAGLRCDAGIVPGERVTIVLDQSITMPGRVVWRRGRNAGIAFDEPFYDDAPEMRFLQRFGGAPEETDGGGA
ncbi:MAG: PilZ domain-containing protein [Hyphomicrobiaceae bacterium]|nr:PilZ domain-containing protein [Hyphomicrobiaceae bacterium]